MGNRDKGRGKRGNFKFFETYGWYVPGVGQMFILLLMLLVGAVLGNVVTLLFSVAGGAEAAADYAMLIAYPVMFIPAMLYAGALSKLASYNSPGFKLDSNNFGKAGAAGCALLVILATLAAGYCADIFQYLLPQMPAWMEEMLDSMTNGVLWVNFISVSIFAPIFEEWLCRGMVLRGLLHKKVRPAWAIVISAAFFALIHLNPWQAVPAFAVGCLFGYVYYRTGSLKLTMLMHFTNNTFSLILSNIDSLKELDSWRDMLPGPLYWIIFAACILLLVLIVRVFARIPLQSGEGNCDRRPSLFEEQTPGGGDVVNP